MPSLANVRRTRLNAVRTSNLPVNYLKIIRERENITLEAMAAKCGITKQALIRVEQGTYERILPSVLDHYVYNLGYSELALVDQYEAFQHLMRGEHKLYFGPNLETNPLIDLHPFRQLRGLKDATPTEVAKNLCIPQATIVHWEKHIRQQQSVPKCIVNVLDEIGYKKSQISSLIDSYATYRQAQLGKNIRGLQ